MEKKVTIPQMVTENEYQQSKDILKQVLLKYNEVIKQETNPILLDMAWSELIEVFRAYHDKKQITFPFFIYPSTKEKIVTIRKEDFLGIQEKIKNLRDEVRELEKKK